MDTPIWRGRYSGIIGMEARPGLACMLHKMTVAVPKGCGAKVYVFEDWRDIDDWMRMADFSAPSGYRFPYSIVMDSVIAEAGYYVFDQYKTVNGIGFCIRQYSTPQVRTNMRFTFTGWVIPDISVAVTIK